MSGEPLRDPNAALRDNSRDEGMPARRIVRTMRRCVDSEIPCPVCVEVMNVAVGRFGCGNIGARSLAIEGELHLSE